MSYILEALKKSERQREIGQVPGISSVHESTAKSVSGKWLWLIVTVLLLNAGLLGLLLWPEPEPELDSATVSKPFREPEPAEASPDRPAVAPIVSQPPALKDPVPRVPHTANIAPAAEPPAAEPVKTETAPQSVVQGPVMAAAGLPAQPRVEPPPGPAAKAEPPVQPPVEPPPRPAAKVELPKLPVWPQIPTQLFQQLNGNLRLDVHVFSDQPEKSFVLINMKKYKQGEKLKEGPQLDEITSEGVILSFRGQRFRVQAQ